MVRSDRELLARSRAFRRAPSPDRPRTKVLARPGRRAALAPRRGTLRQRRTRRFARPRSAVSSRWARQRAECIPPRLTSTDRRQQCHLVTLEEPRHIIDDSTVASDTRRIAQSGQLGSDPLQMVSQRGHRRHIARRKLTLRESEELSNARKGDDANHAGRFFFRTDGSAKRSIASATPSWSFVAVTMRTEALTSASALPMAIPVPAH